MGQKAPRGGQDGARRGGRRHPLRMLAQQELHAKLRLHLGQRHGNRRLRHVKPRRRTGDRAFVHRRQEIFELSEREILHGYIVYDYANPKKNEF